ncbi:MAG: EAL domain-containing protein [Bryobacteraceae bacterium]
MEVLRRTGQQLEELTAGQVDTVVDTDGRTLFLRGTQQQLKRSEDARQAAILNALPAHIALLDTRGIIISVNDAWRLFGTANVEQGPGYGVGLNYLEVCDRARGDGSSEAHVVAEGIRSVLAGEKRTLSVEYPCHSPTEQRWFEVVVTPLRQDQPVGAVVMHVNVTSRKRMEGALRDSNQKFQQLADTITDVFWIRSPDMRELHYISPAYERIWGRSVESLYSNPHHWTDCILPEDRDRVIGAFTALAGQTLSIDIHYRIVRPDNQIRWIRVRGFQVRDTSDILIRLSGVVTDVTESHNAAEALRASLEEFRTLAEAMPQIVWITGPDGRNLYFNRQWMDYTGLTLEESLGDGWNAPFHPEDRERAWDAWRHATTTIDVYALECRLRGADGVYRWWLIRGVPLQDATGVILKWFGTCTDIHDLKLVEESLFLEKESAQVRLNSIGDAVVCTDISGKITFLNSVAEKVTDWSFEEAANRPMVEILRIKHASAGDAMPSLMDKVIRQNQTAHLPGYCVFSRRDGREVPIEGSIAPIHDRKGQVTGTVIVVRDVTASRAMALQITHLAEHDFLTGLPNRLLLNDRINQAIVLAPRHEKQVALLFLDLDGFKHINDSLGHSIGDKLLQSTGKRLVDCVRAADTVSRQGGDEFVVLLSELEHPEDVAITARRILQAVAEPHSIDQHDFHITASIGLSVYPDDGLDAETLIKNADTAMYQAKENGRQSYQFFKPAMNVRAVERQSIEESLRRALERQEFALHFQPKVNLKTGEITGAEALLRWTHPTRGLVSPAQFIPVAEDSGLILPIGNWVLREACKQARVWANAGLRSTTIAVNVSAMEFRQESFLEDVFGILRETGLDPRLLELELTESVLMKDAGTTESILKALRAGGVRLAVDDFGTGYSSLSYLRKFPIDALQIDQSFVRQITIAPDETTIVTAIISMGRSLKLRVVAEGVETQEQLAFLQAHECDEAQGYYFSRPVPPEQFARLLRAGIQKTSAAKSQDTS